ncbi:MAG: disulfide bond formation protein DsbA [Betaproteobacteria bacterium RIFCSPLOWO2_02_67_12]|nr:MAG: disulfide bond formation protein DsbA [Betaproteobacteria bacterium RIFCSPLOWO2_02_67_12]OGA28059.1 MAG: disulfide bond formation protein DsbA [Betaproteobacteria bacterium RIFCSPLOWO2_02_FULL_68_150]OGA68506.1 MAG: disulfide bond formation protein DsbA [Betaproteobacteria bacterium RIFCSPLOWO2_12_FULL_67_28]
MASQLEFWFDLGSPAAYLAWKRLPKFLARSGANVVYKPMLLGGVFKAQGNASPVTIPAKGKWLVGDLARYARRDGVALGYPPGFPINTLALMRGAIGLQMRRPERFGAYVDAMFDAIFGRARDLRDEKVVAEVLLAAGFDAAEIMALAADPEVKQALIRNTEEAVSRGVFGAPTFFVGDEMFWGQDRMEFVAEALAA